MSDKNQDQSNQETIKTEKEVPPEAVLAGQPLSVYFKAIIRPVFISIALLVLSEFTETLPYLDWIVAFGLFCYVGWRFVSKKTTDTLQAVVAGGLAGSLLGLSVALFRFIVHLNVTSFFQIITEPITYAIIGMLTAGAIYWWSPKQKPNSKSLIKKQLTKKSSG
ncbi:MAG: hypothetical protein PHH01_00980 [Patescibacteria group bacterium]|nr:hypothetical protein [Patescibacteria group bacterium]